MKKLKKLFLHIWAALETVRAHSNKDKIEWISINKRRNWRLNCK